MYSSSPPPPGWYDNPVGDGQRFWDGQQWTGKVRIPWPEPGATPPPPTMAMPLPLPLERVRRNAPGPRRWLAIGVVGVLAVIGAVVAAVNSSHGETDAGSASGSTVAVAPLLAAPGTEQSASGAPAAPLIESTTTVPATTVTIATTAAPATAAAPTTGAPTTRPPTSAAAVAPVTSATAPPTTPAPTTQATAAPTTPPPATSVVETTVADAVSPGAFCSPEGSTGQSAKGVPMICSSTNAQGVPYGEGKSRWRSQ